MHRMAASRGWTWPFESRATGSVVAPLITPYSSAISVWDRGLKPIRKIDANHSRKRTCANESRTSQGPQSTPPADPAQAAHPASQEKSPRQILRGGHDKNLSVPDAAGAGHRQHPGENFLQAGIVHPQLDLDFGKKRE